MESLTRSLIYERSTKGKRKKDNEDRKVESCTIVCRKLRTFFFSLRHMGLILKKEKEKGRMEGKKKCFYKTLSEKE